MTKPAWATVIGRHGVDGPHMDQSGNPLITYDVALHLESGDSFYSNVVPVGRPPYPLDIYMAPLGVPAFPSWVGSVVQFWIPGEWPMPSECQQ